MLLGIVDSSPDITELGDTADAELFPDADPGITVQGQSVRVIVVGVLMEKVLLPTVKVVGFGQ